ncbi:MAG: hypothetical protein RL563_2674 [Pseudomonadota bacterium]|jgi:hypothetical protein
MNLKKLLAMLCVTALAGCGESRPPRIPSDDWIEIKSDVSLTTYIAPIKMPDGTRCLVVLVRGYADRAISCDWKERE